jgi:predicted negative regulator of RcsB-dependent stress response
VDLLSEGDQWEAVKAWLRQNGLPIVGGLLLGALALTGWRWWQNQQVADQQASYAAYENLLGTFDAGDADASQKQFDLFISTHGKSAYGSPARLIFARLLVAGNDLERALVQVRTVADTSTDVQLRQVAKLRVARLQTAMGKPDEALATLGSADVGSFQSAYAEARGDALQAKGDTAGALREYQAAKAARTDASATSAESDLLALKINDLQGATP